MTDEQIILRLDQIEAEMRQVETRVFRIREALRQRIDPRKRRKDLGYWPDEYDGALRPMPVLPSEPS